MAVLYSFFVEDAGPLASRFEVREALDEYLRRPLDPTSEEAQEYEEVLWAKKNTEAAASRGFDAETDPFLVGSDG